MFSIQLFLLGLQKVIPMQSKRGQSLSWKACGNTIADMVFKLIDVKINGSCKKKYIYICKVMNNSKAVREYGKITKSSKNKKLFNIWTNKQTNKKKRIKRLKITEKQKQEFYINLA